MATLGELLALEGVAVAVEFARDGSLIDYEANMDMSEEMAGSAAQFCATVSMMFDTLAGAFTQVSGMSWDPQEGWSYSGGDWTVAFGEGGSKGVFVEAAKADLNRIFQVLRER